MSCEGCELEKEECFYWQEKGFDAGLDWGKEFGTNGKEHCSFVVLNKKGEIMIW